MFREHNQQHIDGCQLSIWNTDAHYRQNSAIYEACIGGGAAKFACRIQGNSSNRYHMQYHYKVDRAPSLEQFLKRKESEPTIATSMTCHLFENLERRLLPACGQCFNPGCCAGPITTLQILSLKIPGLVSVHDNSDLHLIHTQGKPQVVQVL